VRAGIVRYDATDQSPAGIRRQLQDHFDVVLALLYASTSTSIETALNRLEASQPTAWSRSDRAAWRKRLLIARYVQLQRLTVYRERGLFPINESQALEQVPIFVDRHDTACAVGHLMRRSGWAAAVASIVASHNYVYVPDVDRGPIADWILTSGLTLEEAALIQPAYPNIPHELPRIPADAVRPMEAGWSGVFDDLRFSNFRFYRDGAAAPSVNAAVTHSFCNSWGCSILPRMEDYNGQIEHTGWFPVLPDGFDDFERVVVQFDVEAALPFQRIASKPRASTAYTRHQQPVLGQRNDVLLFAGDTEGEVLMDGVEHWDGPTGIIAIEFPANGFIGTPINAESWPPLGVFGQDNFRPTRRMNVVTELLLRDGQSYQAQLFHFDVVEVPEPETVVSLVASLVAFGAWRRGHTKRVSSLRSKHTPVGEF
jgi:hypothetical protein